MRFAEPGSLAIGLLFVLFVMTMVPVDQVLELPDLMFEMDSLNFGIVQFGIYGVLISRFK